MPISAEDKCLECKDYNIEITLDKKGTNQRVIVYSCLSCNHIKVECLKIKEGKPISWTYV